MQTVYNIGFFIGFSVIMPKVFDVLIGPAKIVKEKHIFGKLAGLIERRLCHYPV